MHVPKEFYDFIIRRGSFPIIFEFPSGGDKFHLGGPLFGILEMFFWFFDDTVFKFSLT